MSKSALEDQLYLEMEASKLPLPERNYRFHDTRKWRFDFAWVGEKIALEVEGGTWIKGRHSRGAGYAKDCEKYNEAALLGWKIFRVTTDMVKDGRAIELVKYIFGK